MKAYSLDLRQKIVAACDRNQGSQRQVAQTFGVSLGFVEKLLRQRRRTGDLAPRSPRGGKPLLDPAALQLVGQLVGEQPDITLQELCDLAHQQQGIRVSVPTMCTWLQRLGLVRKKVSARQRTGYPQSAASAPAVPATAGPDRNPAVEVPG
jgi:transposase